MTYISKIDGQTVDTFEATEEEAKAYSSRLANAYQEDGVTTSVEKQKGKAASFASTHAEKAQAYWNSIQPDRKRAVKEAGIAALTGIAIHVAALAVFTVAKAAIDS